MTLTIMNPPSARFGHGVRGVVIVAAATALLLVGKPAFAQGSDSVAPSSSRAASPTNVQPRPTRMRSVPLFAIGVTGSAVGVGLLYMGVLEGLDARFCSALSRLNEVTSGVSNSSCDTNAGAMLVAGAVITLMSVPLMVIGAKRVPAKPPLRATLVPVPVARGVGLGIRLEL